MRSLYPMPEINPLVTAEELERFPSDDYRYELVEGRIIRMSPVGFEHGRTVIRLGALLYQHVRELDLGAVVTEVGFTLARNPDTVRAPDVAFIRSSRTPSPDSRGFFTGPPDLAVEVLSPDDRPSDVRKKVEEYLTHGAAVVVVVNPAKRTVTLYRRMVPPRTLRHDSDQIDLGDVVPGFTCSLPEVFD